MGGMAVILFVFLEQSFKKFAKPMGTPFLEVELNSLATHFSWSAGSFFEWLYDNG
jgi:hypothetical protein